MLSLYSSSQVHESLVHIICIGAHRLYCLLFVVYHVCLANKDSHSDVLLEQNLLPVNCSIFQRDNALAHRSRDTVQYFVLTCTAFIPQWLWPPNSPDINFFNDEIWAFCRRVCRTRINSVDHLMQRLVEEWHHFRPQDHGAVRHIGIKGILID